MWNNRKAVKEKFGVPVVTSMNEETPGVDMFKKDMYILKGGNIASKMRQDVKANGKSCQQASCW